MYIINIFIGIANPKKYKIIILIKIIFYNNNYIIISEQPLNLNLK
jgi:hypothetical protein